MSKKGEKMFHQVLWKSLRNFLNNPANQQQQKHNLFGGGRKRQLQYLRADLICNLHKHIWYFRCYKEEDNRKFCTHSTSYHLYILILFTKG